MEKIGMPLSIVDIYRDILPKTNCGDCGFATCLAFAGMVVSEKHALENCPHLPPDTLEQYGKVLTDQYASGKWVKKDLAMLIRPLPRIPIMLMFWDEDQEDGFEAQAKLLFDETVTEHLDIESIVFLSERLRQLLCGANPDRHP